MSQFRITSFPPSAKTAAGESIDCWLVRVVSPEGQRFAVALRGLDTSRSDQVLNGRQASAIVTDLFRPGWERLALMRERPVVLSDKVYRGFLLRRTSRIDEGRPWEIECFVEDSLDARESSWARAILALNSLYQTVYLAPPASDA